MPAVYTHYRFGQAVFSRLPDHLQARIAPHRGLFDIGLLGPDLFFHYRPLTHHPVNRFGHDAHRLPGGQLLQALSARDDGSGESFAYLAGFLCHFALDSCCHGYIDAAVRPGLSHTRLETQLDRSFLLQDGFDPIRQDPAAQILPTAAHARTLHQLYPRYSPRLLRQVLRQTVFYLRLLRPRFAPWRWLMHQTCRLLGMADGFGSMIMDTQDHPACADAVAHIQKLYTEALPLAAELILAYPALTHPQYALDLHGCSK